MTRVLSFFLPCFFVFFRSLRAFQRVPFVRKPLHKKPAFSSSQLKIMSCNALHNFNFSGLTKIMNWLCSAFGGFRVSPVGFAASLARLALLPFLGFFFCFLFGGPFSPFWGWVGLFFCFFFLFFVGGGWGAVLGAFLLPFLALLLGRGAGGEGFFGGPFWGARFGFFFQADPFSVFFFAGEGELFWGGGGAVGPFLGPLFWAFP